MWTIWFFVENVVIFCGWFQRSRRSSPFQVGDSVPAPDQDPQEAVRFLKKCDFFTAEGVVVAPHEKYVDEMFQVEGYKSKPTPDISQWSGDDGEMMHICFHRQWEPCCTYLLTGGIFSTV